MNGMFLDDAIRNTHQNINTTEIAGDDITVVDMDGNIVDVNMALVNIEVDRLQAEFDSFKYQRDRANEYPSWEDQLDDIFHNGIDGWKASIQVVKDKYPKV